MATARSRTPRRGRRHHPAEKFHISLDMAESYKGTVAGMMTNCDELLVVKAKDGQIDAVKAALDQALEDQKEAFSWYGVMGNTERLEAAKVVTSGNYAGPPDRRGYPGRGCCFRLYFRCFPGGKRL